jgi:hypothetical protein
MQCVQSAISNLLEDMKNATPDKKVGVVTFNNDVTVIGDGSKDPVIITGDKLYDYNYLLNNADKLKSQL